MTNLVLAIDAGTTGNRVIAFDGPGRVVASSYYEFPQIHPYPGWVEQDPREIWATTKRALTDVLAEVGADNVACIGITNQRETTIVWNRVTGEPVHNAIVWQCRRTAEFCGELVASGHAPMIAEKTGLVTDAYFSGTKVKWILDNVDGARDAAIRGELAFGTVDTWLLWNLTGGVHATDASNASRTLCYNIHRGEFDDDLLKLLDIPAAVLPDVRDSAGDFGSSTAELTGKTIPITGIVGDQQAALHGQGGWQPDIVKTTYGTGLFLMAPAEESITQPEGLLQTVAWQLDGQRHFALEGSVFIGGAAIQWLRDKLQIIESAADTEELALSLDSNEGVYVVPALSGLGAPWWDPNARGTIVGLTGKSDRRHIVRATLESLAYQTMDVVRLMNQDLSIIRVDGGAAANNFLMQFQADLLGIPVERPAILETTALGAAAMAAFHAGVWSHESFLAQRQVDRVFEPAINDGERDALVSRWHEAVSRSRDWA
jgi:glycerol kinase